MAEYNALLGIWKSTTGAYFNSQEEAEAEDATASSGGSTSTDRDLSASGYLGGFGGGFGGGITGLAPAAAARAPDRGDSPNPSNPGGISDNELARRNEALRTSARRTANINVNSDRTTGTAAPLAPGGGATGAYTAGSDASRRGFDYMHDLGSTDFFTTPTRALNSAGERAGVSHAGDAASTNPLEGGLVWGPEALAHGAVTKASNLGTPADGIGGRPVTDAASTVAGTGTTRTPFDTGTPTGTPTSERETLARQETQDAEDRSRVTDAENAAENESLWTENLDRLRALTGGDYAMSDEARGYQKEGLQQQRQLLERILGFDPNQYATQFADQALARQIAAGRSSGTSAAAQQAGTFAAMDQAPALYAEGARQAEGIQASRLGQAENAIKAFGELGTMTRNSDENRQQFETGLQLEIGKTFNDAVQGKMQLNEQESARMAEVWMNFAQLQSVYAGQSLEEQLKTIDVMMHDQELDQQWEMFKSTMKANGEVSTKDLISGFFQLGGGLLGAGGAIGAAYAGKKN